MRRDLPTELRAWELLQQSDPSWTNVWPSAMADTEIKIDSRCVTSELHELPIRTDKVTSRCSAARQTQAQPSDAAPDELVEQAVLKRPA
jgi:hypothetical protein